eukprot:m.995096 g.995096  ORF g.995096 m.995096 type:complete len:1471 (-) comp24015_c0_seq6:198-4610(-)
MPWEHVTTARETMPLLRSGNHDEACHVLSGIMLTWWNQADKEENRLAMMRDGVLEIVSEVIRALVNGNTYVEQTCMYACGAFYNLSRHTVNSREMRQAFIDCHASEVFKAMSSDNGKPSLYAALVSAYLNTTKTVRMGISVLSSAVQNQRLVECLEASIQGYGYMGGGWSVEEVLGGISGLLVTEVNRESLTQCGLISSLLQLLDMGEAIVQTTGCIAKLVFYGPAREELLAGDVVAKLDLLKEEASKCDGESDDAKFSPADARSIRSNIIAALFNLDPQRSEELREAFSTCLEKGSKPWMRSKIMLVGQGRSGKTAFLNAMRRKDFEQTDSTIGIDTMTMEVTSLASGREWWDVYDKKGTSEVDRARTELTAALLAGGGVLQAEGTVMDFLSEADAGGDGTSGGDTEENVASDPQSVSTAGKTNKTDKTDKKAEVDAGVSKMDKNLFLESMTQDGDDEVVVLEAWDYGGQEVFYALHHLFLTRFGVYCVLFNMEWLASTATDDQRAQCLAFLRFWLNSIAVHTTDTASGSSAPVVLIGTHKDKVSDPTEHERISRILHENFSTNPAFPYNTCDKEGEASTGRAVMWFYPVDNTRGHSDPCVMKVMMMLQRTVMDEDYIRQQVPFVWLKVYDKLQSEVRPAIALSDMYTICDGCGLPASTTLSLEKETAVMLRFFHELGVLMWHKDPALRDWIVLDPAKYLVGPATKIICEHAIHAPPEHRAAQRLRAEWNMLSGESATLDRRLLPALWAEQDAVHHDQLLFLMIKYGLVVPITDDAPPAATAPRTPSSGSSSTTTTGGAPRDLFLVPSLLKPKPLSQRPGDALECLFAFGTDEKQFSGRNASSTVEVSALKDGFLPNGIFSRLLGKVVLRNNQTLGMPPQLSKSQARTSFGSQKFTLQEVGELNAVRLHLEMDNPVGVITIFQDLIQETLDECIPNLKFTLLLPLPSDGETQQGGALIARDVLINACNEQSPVWIGEQSLEPSYLREHLAEWLPPSGELDAYDIFFSYRHGDPNSIRNDSKFLSTLVDSISFFTVGKEQRRVEVFYDAIRLQPGQSWLLGFTEALVRSRGAVPIVSVDALQRMLGMTENSPRDNVLLEWSLMIELQIAGKLQFIFPIIIGKRLNSATGDFLSNFYKEGILDRLPKVVPSAVVQATKDVLEKHGITPSQELESRTVWRIVCKLCEFVGLHLIEFFVSHGAIGHATSTSILQKEFAGLYKWCASSVCDRVHTTIEPKQQVFRSQRDSRKEREVLDKEVVQKKERIGNPAILCKDAAQFWEENFHGYKEVEWYLFSYAIAEEFPGLTPSSLSAIKDAVDINKDGKVHELEFNIFSKKKGFRDAIAFASKEPQFGHPVLAPEATKVPPFHDAVLSGVLLKRSDSKKTRWKRRMVVLEPRRLMYFEHDGGGDIKGFLHCSAITRAMATSAEGEFIVFTRSKEYFFKVEDTDSAATRDKWITHLQAAIDSETPAV